MLLNVVCLAALLLLGVAAGVSYSHLLQWGPKATLGASEFLTIQQVLISRYGAGVGAVETLAVLALALVAFLARDARAVRRAALAALACVLAMIAIWAAWIQPINAAVNSWAAATVPPDWPEARDRWHTLHAVRFALSLVAAGTLGWAVTRPTRAAAHTQQTPERSVHARRAA